MANTTQIRLPFDELCTLLTGALVKLGFTQARARICARLFAEASRDGVYSHGVNRFPRFVRAIRNGLVNPQATPEIVSGFGSLERWDGKLGPGNLNAQHCMQRAIEICHQHGIGLVALGNTNHWMRGGAYGWQAAEAGVIGICWTNTMPNLPPWGASDPKLGNNPIIIAVPRGEGHVVLDMAVSQFSYGAIESYRLRGELLPVPGGFTQKGELTRDPAEIEKSQRPLPIGYWKGSGMALMLDMIASVLSGGLATHQLIPDAERETKLSQIFIAIDPAALGSSDAVNETVNKIIADLHATQSSDGGRVRYPGEQVLRTRRDNLEMGVPVNRAVWDEVQKLG